MLNRVPIYQALNRPVLFMGAERELMVFSLLIPFLIIYLNVFSLMSWIIGISIWVILSILLRQMAKADPMLSKIYMRQRKYKKYYRAVRAA